MIKLGIRKSFDRIDQIEERFSDLSVPIEIALPYHWNIYDPIRPHLQEISDKLKTYHTEILSVHSVQAPITDQNFKLWGKETADFAKMLGVKLITVHPDYTKDKQTLQQTALDNLEYLRRLYNEEIIFSIETFARKKRVFTPAEIVKFNLPMTLDTAHIKNDQHIWNLLQSYKDNIVEIHLSAKSDTTGHLPIDDFCREVVDYLVNHNWNGKIILEYLPDFHDRILTDLESLSRQIPQ